VYYNNNNWQVLSEYDGSNNFQRNCVYGNYIDEVLMMTDSGSNDYYYAHDHLFSPAALIDDNGTVVERYEYDAYGDCNVLDADYSKDPDGISDYGNPYLFTGRRLDILDEGNFKIMYYRSRYYDPETGRLLTHDPLGITPNPERPNRFNIFDHYKDSMSLYQYAISNPIVNKDTYGLIGDPGFTPEETLEVIDNIRDLNLSAPAHGVLRPAGFVGFEIHFVVGYGQSSVSCCDEELDRREFMFIKSCIGGALLIGFQGGLVLGLDGANCSYDTYDGWFYEGGGSLGPWGLGVDIGYNDDGSFSGVGEIGPSLGGGAVGFQSSWCFYECYQQRKKRCGCVAGCDYEWGQWTSCGGSPPSSPATIHDLSLQYLHLDY